MRKWIGRAVRTFFGLVITLLAVQLVLWLLAPRLSPARLAAVIDVQEPGHELLADSATIWVKRVVDSLRLPSLSAAAAVDGRVIWATAIGHADLKRLEPSTPDTRYRIGSVSKAVTSVVLARLVDDGLVSLEDSIGEFLPGVPAAGATLGQLASHMGGVRHYSFTNGPALLREQFGRQHYPTAVSALELFVDDPLVFPPGTDFRYSTHGYTLLSAGLERATDADYLSLLARTVTEPLGLQSIGPDDITQPLPARAVSYNELAGRFFPPFDADPSYKWAGGGLLSTPSDLVLMGSALTGSDFVSPTVRDQLWTVRTLPSGEPNHQNYGLGWRVEEAADPKADDPLRMVHHGGTSPGGSAFLVLVPSHQVAVAILTNRSLSDPGFLRDQARRIGVAFASARVSDGMPAGR